MAGGYREGILGVGFCGKKSKVMIEKRSGDEREATWSLEGNVLQQTVNHKYLGAWVGVNGCIRARNEISMVNQWVGGALGECSVVESK